MPSDAISNYKDDEEAEEYHDSNQVAAALPQQEIFDAWVEKASKKPNCVQHSIWNKRVSCVQCAERDRAFVNILRRAAISNVTFYTIVYLNPKAYTSRSWPKEVFMTVIVVMIQAVLPAAIIVQTMQNEDAGTGLLDMCPHNSDPFARIAAFLLSAYFGITTLQICQGKLRGIVFLLVFCPLQGFRRHILLFSAVSQFVGILLANVAQFLVFIQTGDASYLRLMFVSLAMQFSLHVDSRLKSSHQDDLIGDAIKEIGQDKYLGGGAGVGCQDEVMPYSTAFLIHRVRQMQIVVERSLVFLGAVLSVAVTVCI